MQDILKDKKIININEIVIIIFLIVFTLLIRFILLKNILTNSDPAWYWFSAKKLLFGFPYNSWNHATIRFSVIFPLLFIQRIFGIHPTVYYFTPILMSVILAVFTYKLGTVLLNKYIGFFAGIFTILFPKMEVLGIQIFPDIFAAAYIVISIYFLILFQKKENKKYIYLIISSIFLFIAYQAKITSLFFLPGILVFIFFSEKKIKYAAVYLLVLFVGYCSETIILFILTKNILGKIGIILNSHLSGNQSLEKISFFGLFTRYLILGWYWKAVILAFIISSIYICFFTKKNNIKFFVLIVYSFLLFETFAVKSINPIRPLEPFRDRYLIVMIPLMIICMIIFINEILVKIKGYLDKINFNKQKKKILFIKQKLLFLIQKEIVVFLLIGIIILSFVILRKYDFKSPYILTEINKKYNIINNAYENGTLIAADNTKEGNKILFAINCIFLNDLLKDKDVFYKDPESWSGYKSLSVYSPKEYVVNDKEMLFIVKNNKKYDFDKIFNNLNQKIIYIEKANLNYKIIALKKILKK